MSTTSASNRSATNLPSEAWVGQIAREVLRRLRSEVSSAERPSQTPAVKLVTLETLRSLGSSAELRLTASAVVTPAAKEEARRRGIRLVTATSEPAAEHSVPATADGEFADDLLTAQLNRRGVTLPDGVDVVWTQTPAVAVCQHCSAGKRAVMVTTYADVDRFFAELSPQVWILDAERLSLVAATNVATRIARLSIGKGEAR